MSRDRFMQAGQAQLSGVIVSIGHTSQAAANHIKNLRGWALVEAASFEEAANYVKSTSERLLLMIGDAHTAVPRDYLLIAQVAAERSPETVLGFLYGRGEEQLLQAAKKLPVKPTPGQNILPQFVYNAAPDRSFLSGARLADPCEAAASPRGTGQTAYPADGINLPFRPF